MPDTQPQVPQAGVAPQVAVVVGLVPEQRASAPAVPLDPRQSTARDTAPCAVPHAVGQGGNDPASHAHVTHTAVAEQLRVVTGLAATSRHSLSSATTPMDDVQATERVKVVAGLPQSEGQDAKADVTQLYVTHAAVAAHCCVKLGLVLAGQDASPGVEPSEPVQVAERVTLVAGWPHAIGHAGQAPTTQV